MVTLKPKGFTSCSKNIESSIHLQARIVLITGSVTERDHQDSFQAGCYRLVSRSVSASPPDVRLWLCPAGRAALDFFLGFAPGSALAQLCRLKGRARTGGEAQFLQTLPAGQSHSLTSGGEAESVAQRFLAPTFSGSRTHRFLPFFKHSMHKRVQMRPAHL
jgi:hypothetical protein